MRFSAHEYFKGLRKHGKRKNMYLRVLTRNERSTVKMQLVWEETQRQAIRAGWNKPGERSL